jgi:hypothetical protein
MQDEADLIGQRRAATGAIRGELCLVQFDEVLGLTTRAVETVIQPFGVVARDVGDGVADIKTHGGGLDAGCDTALAAPGFGTVAGVALQICLRIFSILRIRARNWPFLRWGGRPPGGIDVPKCGSYEPAKRSRLVSIYSFYIVIRPCNTGPRTWRLCGMADEGRTGHQAQMGARDPRKIKGSYPSTA